MKTLLVSGSKRHLLSQIFAKPKSPFANWGFDIEMPHISTPEYQEYINERFGPHGLSIDKDAVEYLQEVADNIPEAINMICLGVIEKFPKTGAVTREKIILALNYLLESRQSRFEESLAKHSLHEVSFLKALSESQPTVKITGKEFVAKTNTSASGILKISKKLEDDAVIYRTDKGFSISDPIFARYVKKYR